jgi:RNA-directed DNA polymerase
MTVKETNRSEGRPQPPGTLHGERPIQTQSWAPLPTNLVRVNDAAKRSCQTRFTALFHHLDVAALERAFRRLRRRAAPGVDGMTVAVYEQNLEDNLRELHACLHAGQYRPLPARRSYIPKADGGQRPLGIIALEDKIAQSAVAEILNAIYEADFHDCSFGFRARRVRTTPCGPCTHPGTPSIMALVLGSCELSRAGGGDRGIDYLRLQLIPRNQGGACKQEV